MNTIHIERLDLRCRGVAPAEAQAAVGHLGPALQRQLNGGKADAAGLVSDLIRVSGGVAPRSLAEAVAARVARIVHSHATGGVKPGES